GQVIGHDLIHKVRIKLWYVLDGKRGEVTHYGQTQFAGRNKYGLFTDEEAPKKSLTDAMSKALSMLGFGADIHLGLYDDNKYVSSLRRQFAEKAAAALAKAPDAPDAPAEQPAGQEMTEVAPQPASDETTHEAVSDEAAPAAKAKS